MSESVQITGDVYHIGETETFSSGFQKRILVIKTTDEKYPQTIPVEFVKDRCELLDDVRLNDLVTAHVNLRGNEWKERFFLSAQCWKLENKSVEGVIDKHNEEKSNGYQNQPFADAPHDDSDEVPF